MSYHYVGDHSNWYPWITCVCGVTYARGTLHTCHYPGTITTGGATTVEYVYPEKKPVLCPVCEGSGDRRLRRAGDRILSEAEYALLGWDKNPKCHGCDGRGWLR